MTDGAYRALRDWLRETEDEPLESMAAFFEARLDGYESHMQRFRAQYRLLAEQLPAATETLLDLGCGTGLELDAIFARFETLHVVGVDLSERMLAQLRAKHPGRALTLLCADYLTCDLGTNAFDAAVSFETLHHFSQATKRRLFQKICDSLKPGGVYLECDYIATCQAMEDLAFQACRNRRHRDGIPDGVLVHFDTPLTLSHEMQAMRDGGFSQVELIGFVPGDRHTPLIRARKGV